MSLSHQRISAICRQNRHIDGRCVIGDAEAAVLRLVFLVMEIDNRRNRAGDDSEGNQRRPVVHPATKTFVWNAANERERENHPQDLLCQFRSLFCDPRLKINVPEKHTRDLLTPMKQMMTRSGINKRYRIKKPMTQMTVSRHEMNS